MADLKDGSARILLIGDESGYRYYVKREEKDTVFLVSKSKIDRMFKDLEELKAEIEEEPEEQEAAEMDKPAEADRSPE
jgi:pyruvate/2-oxoacid:ferredoxin oxidoreductase alpha subunit